MRIDVYDSPGSDSQQYRSALKTHCAALGIQLDIGLAVPGTSAKLTLLFANSRSSWTNTQNLQLEQLVKDSALILPVIDTAPDAAYLPQALREINAFKKHDTGAAWHDSLVDETLSMAWLDRRARKVFISYRRIDSAPIASQLFAHFSQLGYEVFLDDASIERGVNFQQELKWWLNDADLLLALCSPRLRESQWCVEELTFAQSHSIGVAALEWPKEIYQPYNTVQFAGTSSWKTPVPLDLTLDDQRMRLGLGDFDGVDADNPGVTPKLEERKLTPAAIERVVGFCARNRAASIRSRLNNLLPLVRDTIQQKNALNITQSFGDLTYNDVVGKTYFVRVLPFRPLPEHLYRAYADGRHTELSVCAYPECDVEDARAKALRWLAEKTDISSTGGAKNNELWAFCGETLL